MGYRPIFLVRTQDITPEMVKIAAEYKWFSDESFAEWLTDQPIKLGEMELNYMHGYSSAQTEWIKGGLDQCGIEYVEFADF